MDVPKLNLGLVSFEQLCKERLIDNPLGLNTGMQTYSTKSTKSKKSGESFRVNKSYLLRKQFDFSKRAKLSSSITPRKEKAEIPNLEGEIQKSIQKWVDYKLKKRKNLENLMLSISHQNDLVFQQKCLKIKTSPKRQHPLLHQNFQQSQTFDFANNTTFKSQNNKRRKSVGLTGGKMLKKLSKMKKSVKNKLMQVIYTDDPLEQTALIQSRNSGLWIKAYNPAQRRINQSQGAISSYAPYQLLQNSFFNP